MQRASNRYCHGNDLWRGSLPRVERSETLLKYEKDGRHLARNFGDYVERNQISRDKGVLKVAKERWRKKGEFYSTPGHQIFSSVLGSETDDKIFECILNSNARLKCVLVL